MKKKLIFTLPLLVIGFGVCQVLLQGEDGKRQQETVQPQIAQTPAVKVQITQAEVPGPSIAEVPVTQASFTQPPITQSQSESFYFLLHPDRKNPTEFSDSEDDILNLYNLLQSELRANNTSAAEQHADLKQALEKYIESRTNSKSATTNSSDDAPGRR